VTATYGRSSGESAAGSPYHITATLNAAAGVLDNYNITNVGADFTISKRDATWTTNPNSKTYGDADPAPLTTGSGTFLAADSVTATYGRSSGESAAGSPYHITATLSAAAGVLDNYNITNAGADFTISKRDATWTTNPNSKTYGDADPAPLTTGSGTFLAADSVTAIYSRSTGETAGDYPITATLSPAGVLDNYNITYNTAKFTIDKKDAAVTPGAASKTYGDVDPVLTGTLTGFLAADGVTAEYSRTAGETVAGGPYTVSAVLSPAGVISNYNVTYNTAAFTITAKAAAVTANNRMKTYGDAVTFAGTEFTTSGFVSSDGVTSVTLTSAGAAASATVTTPGPTYAIVPSGAVGTGLGNYAITYQNGTLTINPKALTITATDRTKILGAAVTFAGTEITTSELLGSDGVTSVLLTSAGAASSAAVGSYDIEPSAAVGPGLGNYAITYIKGKLG